ncbi:MAG: methyl-accepting chemotaxis protein [Pseudomonadota bacterium]
MIVEMNIPKKLSLSFVFICVSAAVMMVVLLSTILMIRATTESNNRSQAIHADALALETAILRQNSQLRGYLVTGDKSYLKSYYEGRDEYDQVSKKLTSILTDPAMLDAVKASRTATLAWRRDWGDRLIQVVGSGRRDEAQQEVRDAGAKVLVSAAVLPLRDVRSAEVEHIAENGARQQTAIVTAIVALAIGGVALIAVAMTLSRMLSRTIARPITTLTQAMTQLAEGDNAIEVDAARADELGDMARAVLVFRDAALAKAEADRAKAEADEAKDEADRARIGAEAAQRRVVETLDTALAALASGDLTHVISAPFEPEYERLRQSFNSAVEGLERSIAGVARSAQSVHAGASDIYSASEDLSLRTEQQASRLQETSSATRQVTVMVGETARRAAEARTAIEVANGNAAEGGAIVTEAISAMDAIKTSSEEIGQIINLIDAITFQTNLLALNAGVEAARAGDAGKGFAVVASEVRALAQRSADAARDIKALINTSAEQVQSGVGRVGDTGEMLTLIGAKIEDTNTLIYEIARNTETQADNLKQVSSAVASMDSMTQQNAAMVKESTAAARSLAAEADELATLVARFRLRSAALDRDLAASHARRPPLQVVAGR